MNWFIFCVSYELIAINLTQGMLSVLVIENDADINESTCELLELAGYSVLTSGNGEAGITLARQENPDIILCDIWMPGKDGYQVLDELKASCKTAEIPFVFFSASTEPGDVKRGMAMGAHSYLCKPFTERQLLDVIEKATEKARS